MRSPVLDAIDRLEELEKKKVLFISDGTSGSMKVSALLAFTEKTIPTLRKLLEHWEAEGKYTYGEDSPLGHQFTALAYATLNLPNITHDISILLDKHLD